MDTDHLFTEMCDNGSTHASRIEDLGPGDFVKVDCAACCRRLPRELSGIPLLAHGAAFHGIPVPARPTGQGARPDGPRAMSRLRGRGVMSIKFAKP
jgi:hypothetical protein